MRRSTQRGFAALVLLVALVMGALYALLTSLNDATAQMTLQRDEVTQAALRQAKEALIAWSARHLDQPGALPCPDTNDDGVLNQGYGDCNAASPSAGTPAPIGRLPWRSLGLPDLRDSSGERLWYVVANPARQVSTMGPINGRETLGTLDIEGLSPATGAVAIVFAPGPALQGQTRSGAGINMFSNYLESVNPHAIDKFLAARRCEQSDCTRPFTGGTETGPYNDQLIIITHDDLFNIVENTVIARMRDRLAPKMQALAAKWGRYPFALAFTPNIGNPGEPGRHEGSLPWAYAGPGRAQWQSSPSLGQFAASAGEGTLDPTAGCTIEDPPNNIWLRCIVAHYGGPIRFHIDATALRAGLSFNDIGWQANYGGVDAPLVAVDWSGTSTTADGDASFQFRATTPASSGALTVRIRMELAHWADKYFFTSTDPCTPPPENLTYLWPATCEMAWFTKNDWSKQIYYAISPQVAFGSGGTCGAGSSCLTVNGVSAPNNDKAALLLLAGHKIGTQSRIPAGPSDYLEGENASTGDRIFETGLRSATRNDKIAIIAP